MLRAFTAALVALFLGTGGALAQQPVISGVTREVCVTPPVTAGNAYGANFVVGGLLTFNNAFGTLGGGRLQGVTVTVNKTENQGFTFFPFRRQPTATVWTDDAVAAIAAADIPLVRPAVVPSASINLASPGFTMSAGTNLNIALNTAPTNTTLYGVLLSNGALTTNFATTSDLQVCVQTLSDN